MSHSIATMVGLALSITPAARTDVPRIALTSDVEGHATACGTCPISAKLGGIARWRAATSEAGGDVLRLDAGAFLFGATDPKVVAAAYVAAEIDAVNVATSDFRLGRDFTRDVLAAAGVPAVSANLVDGEGTPLFAPFLVAEQDGRAVAIIGVTERPAALDALPFLSQQLAGITVVDPASALESILPEARAAADAVVLLVHGSAATAASLRERFSDRIDVIGVGGLRPEELGALRAGTPPVLACQPKGTHVTLFGGDMDGPRVVRVTPDLIEDPAVLLALDPSAGVAPDQRATKITAKSSGAIGALDGAQFLAESAEAGAGSGVRIRVTGASTARELGELTAAPGNTLLLLDAAFENDISLDLAFGGVREAGERMLVVFRQKLFLVAQQGPGAGPAQVHPAVLELEGDGLLPTRFELSSLGSVAAGRTIFEVPESLVAAGGGAVELRLYHDEFGTSTVPIRGALDAAPPFEAAAENEYVAFAMPVVRYPDEVDGRPAPRGTRWVELDLVGRSTRDLAPESGAEKPEQSPGGGLGAALGRAAELEPDAPSKDENAAAAIPTPAMYLEAVAHLQLVADWQWATTREPGLGTLPVTPTFLPDRPAGGSVVFLAPANATSLELQAHFPLLKNAAANNGDLDPETLRFALEGEPVEPVPEAALVAVDDDPVDMAVVGASIVEDPIGGFEPKDGTAQVMLDVRLVNDGAEDGVLPFGRRFRGGDATALAVFGRGDAPLDDKLLLPAGSRRAVRVLLEVPSSVIDRGTLATGYVGITVNPSLEIALGAPVAALDVPVAPSDVAVDEVAPPADVGGSPALDVDWAVPGTLADTDVSPKAALDLAGITAVGESSALRLAIESAELVDAIGPAKAAQGKQFLVLRTRWTNLLPPTEETEGAAPQLQYKTTETLHLVLNGRAIVPRAGVAGPKLPTHVAIPERGASRAWAQLARADPQGAGPAPRETDGLLVYSVPKGGVQSIALHHLDPDHGNLVLAIAGTPPDEPPALAPIANAVAELAPLGWRVDPSGRRDAMAIVSIDVRGRSVCSADPADHGGRAEPVAYRPLGWKTGRFHLLLDGRHAVGLTSSDLPNQPLWLPDAALGGALRFRVPESLLRATRRVELVLGFEDAPLAGRPIQRVEPVVFVLADRPARDLVAGDAMWSIHDGGVTVEARGAVSGTDRLEDMTIVRYLVRNDRECAAWFDPTRSLRMRRADGEEAKIEHYWVASVELPTVHRAKLWLPPRSERVFDLPFTLGDGTPTVHYEGLLRVVDLPLEAGAQPIPAAMPRVDGLDVVDRARPLGGIESVGLDGGRVNRAIDRGRDWMWAELSEDLQKGMALGSEQMHLVTMLALVHAGAHEKYPEFDAALRTFLDRARPLELGSNSTYKNGLLAMTVGAYGDPAYRPLLRDVARYLIEDQGPDGTWDYSAETPARLFELAPTVVEDELSAAHGPLRVSGGPPPEGPDTDDMTGRGPAGPMRRYLPWHVNGDGDNSVTQYAVLGLNACARGGVEIDPDVWRRLLQTTWDRQDVAGGWGYSGGRGYGSMTCAGAGIAAVAMRELEPGRDPVLDPRVRDGLTWLAERLEVGRNPEASRNGQYHIYYYTYGVERVGRLLNTEFFGPHEWYPKMAKWLVERQSESGAWPGMASEREELTTPFAILFLTRATETLDPEVIARERAAADAARPRAGLLQMDAKTSPAKALVFVLDASGSMLAPPGDAKARNGDRTTKFELARDALSETLRLLPDGAPVGLVVYGHRLRARDEGADEDVEVVVPVGPLDRTAFAAKLAALRARGKTPLALSLDAARRAARAGGSRDGTVVLLTDGGQGREPGDPVKSAAAVGKARMTLEIVGFDVDEARSRTAAAWTAQLRAMATAADGRFTAVDDASRLAPTVAAASTGLPGDFEVLDGGGAVIASGPFGGSIELEPGTYTFRTTFAGEPFESEVRIGRGRTTRVEFDATAVPR